LIQKKSSVYSLNTISGVMSERCPSPRLCVRAHTSRLQRWRVVGNVWEIWSARDKQTFYNLRHQADLKLMMIGQINFPNPIYFETYKDK